MPGPLRLALRPVRYFDDRLLPSLLASYLLRGRSHMAEHSAAIDHRRTDTRDPILWVPFRLFATQGYANTSLREISDELGVTKAALYFHFKTKEDILSGIMRDNLDSINAITDSATPSPTAP